MVFKLVACGLLVAHGAIHAAFISPRPPVTAGGPQWPFDIGHSWLLSGVRAPSLQLVGTSLVAVTLAAFVVCGLAVAGVLPASLFGAAAVLGSLASATLLVLFFHPWLVVGLAIDAALIWLAVVASWSPEHLAN